CIFSHIRRKDFWASPRNDNCDAVSTGGRTEVGVERLERSEAIERFERPLDDDQRIVTVDDRRHLTLDTVLFAPLYELQANFRILIFIFDKCATFAQARRRTFTIVPGARVMNGCRILTAAEPERDVSCRLNAAIQVSMEPAIGGAIDTAGFPIASYHLVTFATLKRPHSQFFWPHIDIPLRTNDEKDGSRGVIVGFVIDSRRPFRNMANEAVIRHFEAGDPSLGNFVRRVVNGGDARVSDKVRIPHTGPSRFVT